uniref:Uncharacterized protein n=1 Tax=Anguilla anguilla TaxID=7936 RepID=A0A0E9VU44_ANGAN
MQANIIIWDTPLRSIAPPSYFVSHET